MINSSVLVLNRSFLPVHVTPLKRALCMMVQGIAKAIDEEYQTFDFQNWAELSVAKHHESVGMVDRVIRVPRVVLLSVYDRLPKRCVRFSRLNIMTRDNYTCQYCGKRGPKSDLNLDHVVPRVLGGGTSWDNVVTSCLDCNRMKGGRTPAQAKMHLARKPYRPNIAPLMELMQRRMFHEAWKPFFNIVDLSYWTVELDSD
ncbi:MAG: HNH endonuclease [Deltaproteobacteria bacterium CG11_big_fil_rev_8_21_14_0_20_47_16]|nr:MAG: HNH endonuclease [Deltaproteobacteria bacterium CG11_big_fil_rev_8_21_14_0_20_47_16]